MSTSTLALQPIAAAWPKFKITTFDYNGGTYSTRIVERAEATEILRRHTTPEYLRTVESSIESIALGQTSTCETVRTPGIARYTLEDCTRDAAPALLDALKLMLEEFGSLRGLNVRRDFRKMLYIESARAAILKATTAPELEVGE